jgi:hypothetical protein
LTIKRPLVTRSGLQDLGNGKLSGPASVNISVGIAANAAPNIDGVTITVITAQALHLSLCFQNTNNAAHEFQ